MQGTVLIVDDHPANLALLAHMVGELRDIEAVCFSSSREALDWAAIHNPSLILLDYQMPTPNGIEFIREFRAMPERSETPIVMVTSQQEAEIRHEALIAGANDFLNKPVDRIELIARSRNLLALGESRRRLADHSAWLAEEVALATADIARREQQTLALNESYRRFVPREFLELLGKDSIVDVQLGDQTQREMTILVSDIRSFSTLSEAMTPAENFDFINEYLKRVEPIITKHGGFIDKYIGDAVMALFDGGPDRAVRAAVELQEEVARYNLDRAANAQRPIAIGVGIHTGSLMLGTVGSPGRMDTTVISDAVNLAFRLESLCKDYGARIVTSEPTLLRLENQDEHSVRLLGTTLVKGKLEPVTAYEVFESDPPEERALKATTLARFEIGVRSYGARDFLEAIRYLEGVLRENPLDRAAEFYLQRSGRGG